MKLKINVIYFGNFNWSKKYDFARSDATKQSPKLSAVIFLRFSFLHFGDCVA